MAGQGQFGRPDQGILAYWINSHLRHRPLRYIGFEGKGYQVRDCLHPRDLLPLLEKQMAAAGDKSKPQVINVSGGQCSAISLRQLTQWCDDLIGPRLVDSDPTPRAFDLPWVVLDSTLAKRVWNWRPMTTRDEILDEILRHAQSHPSWLNLTEGGGW